MAAVAIYSEVFELVRFDTREYEELLRTFLRAKYQDKPISAIVVHGAANAMDAMQNYAPGALKMTVQTVFAEGSKVEVSVCDTGTGIPNDKLSGIFETFYATKQHNTGLVLSIARTIVENCGGRIWAENRPGGGAVFRFTMPLGKAHPA
jgi:K+-sensing histidine kinase KdpD